MLKRSPTIGAVAASISVGGCVGVGRRRRPTLLCVEDPGRRRVRRRSAPSSSARSSRGADWAAAQTGWVCRFRSAHRAASADDGPEDHSSRVG